MNEKDNRQVDASLLTGLTGHHIPDSDAARLHLDSPYCVSHSLVNCLLFSLLICISVTVSSKVLNQSRELSKARSTLSL